jgi:hypothetical protein
MTTIQTDTVTHLNRAAFKSFYRNITSPVRLLPNFLIIGANKCGTTTLYDYLKEHPNIGSATKKELHFFDRPYTFSKGLTWYRSQFPISKLFSHKFTSQEKLITGEASPEYLFHPLVPQRVAGCLPDVKIIVMLRNPVDRAYSHYKMTYRNGNENLSFSEAISKESDRIGSILEQMKQKENFFDIAYERYSYLSRGIYVEQLQRWTNFFDRKQILVIKSEDFFAEPLDVLKKVFNFLEIPQWQPEELKVSHVGNYKQKIDSELRSHLNEFFAPHNQRLYEFLGTNYNWEEMY